MSKLLMNLRPDTAYDTEEYRVGTRLVLEEENKEYVFMKAGGTLSALTPVRITNVTYGCNVATSNDIFGVVIPEATVDQFVHVQTKGIVVDAPVATGVTAGDLLALGADSNNRFVEALGVNEGGAANLTSSQVMVRAKAITSESSNKATILLY